MRSFSSVAVVGSGAVGAYYGARLHEGGHSVKFFMRNEHYAHCVSNGLNISVSAQIILERTYFSNFVRRF